jgi:two-component sensor histidine kinase
VVDQDEFTLADAREADHRFANHLALLSGFVRLKAADLNRQPVQPTVEGVQLMLESFRSQIEAMGRLHRSLTLGVRGAHIDLGEQLHEICAPMSLLLAGRVALIEDLSPDCRAPADWGLPLTQIVAEVITNAAKHAYPVGRTGRIIIRNWQDVAGAVVVEIADDGPGLPDGFEPETDSGLGFHLIRALATQLDAVAEFENSGVGLCFRLTLPAEPTD